MLRRDPGAPAPCHLLPALVVLMLVCLTPPAWAGETDKTITNDLGMTFVRIQPGRFLMGSPASEKHRDPNETQHEMEIKRAYYLQETEVTLAQWWAVMGKKWFMRKKGRPDMPVTKVSFFEAMKFIQALNDKSNLKYRLPTEAEWEYACRAGTTTAYFWGNEINCSQALYGNNSRKAGQCTTYLKGLNIPPDGPAPVKQFKPNAWGLYDMHGNVWEWCSDVYAPYGSGHSTNSTSIISTDNRVRRGGSWYKYPWHLRSANRAYAHPGARFQTTGFRLVLEAD